MVILDALVNSGWKGEFIANELSYARRKRLEEVVRTHVPDASRSQIRVKGWDASQIGIRAKETYSRVILDAPCSSERHLLEQDPTMQEWKISRTKQLAQRQYALICSAVLALKPGGVLLYSTCSLSDFENDGVVERLLDRKGDQIQLDPTFQPGFEKTKFGFYILPDRVEGQGPLYFCRLLKSN